MPPLPETCSESLRDFLTLCFNKNPEKRPSAELLFEHEWLQKNWPAHKVFDITFASLPLVLMFALYLAGSPTPR